MCPCLVWLSSCGSRVILVHFLRLKQYFVRIHTVTHLQTIITNNCPMSIPQQGGGV